MRLTVKFVIVLLLAICTAAPAMAEVLQISLGIRETNTTGPIGANGGTANGIEWVDLDGQTLVADNQWHQYTFTLSSDTVDGIHGKWRIGR